MKFPKILSGTILTLALAASFDAAFTSCSCSTSNIPEGWVKICNISSNKGAHISWKYPAKNEDLKVYYTIDDGYKFNEAMAYRDNKLVSDSLTITDTYIQVPARHVWWDTQNQINEFSLSVFAIKI